MTTTDQRSEFLVEFVIHVPEGTAPADVDERQNDEARAAADLAAEGHLVRLWKPSHGSRAAAIGLYRAKSAAILDDVLRALPLADWMLITTTALNPHPSDPGTDRGGSGMEYLVTMTTEVPLGTPAGEVDDIRTREAAHSRELAAHGQLLRLWRPPLRPGEWRSLGLFAAADRDELEEVLASMPLRIWRTDSVVELTAHDNDPP